MVSSNMGISMSASKKIEKASENNMVRNMRHNLGRIIPFLNI